MRVSTNGSWTENLVPTLGQFDKSSIVSVEEDPGGRLLFLLARYVILYGT
jgi:hypothetical protein